MLVTNIFSLKPIFPNIVSLTYDGQSVLVKFYSCKTILKHKNALGEDQNLGSKLITTG